MPSCLDSGGMTVAKLLHLLEPQCPLLKRYNNRSYYRGCTEMMHL